MARNLSTASPETQDAAGIGHNDGPLDQDTFLRHESLVLRHRNGPLALAQAALKAAKKTEKNLLLDAEKSGIKLVQFQAYLKLKETEDEDVASENAKAFHSYCVFGELIQGEQGSLIEALDSTLSPTPGERKDIWFDRGFKDIRFGAIDPEGHVDEKGAKSASMIFPNTKPSYVPADAWTSWQAGAQKADTLNMEDFAAKNAKNATTPVEVAAAAPKNETPPEKPLTQKERDVAAAKAKAEALAAQGATNTEFGETAH